MSNHRKLLTVVMDGVGERASQYGNAVQLAHTPHLDNLRSTASFTTLKAHGKHVGLPSDEDIGNSEVGHNALGCGRLVNQGASLVQQAVKTGSLARGQTWLDLVEYVRASSGSIHFIGLLSDGNVHSHHDHLHYLLETANTAGLKKLRVHALFDGRDVPDGTADSYLSKLEAKLSALRGSGCDALLASGGGRMRITMDRYGADWAMVERGWQTHVQGKARAFASGSEAIAAFTSEENISDQFHPEFVISDTKGPVGRIDDGDGVVFFNFRGDRSIELCQAFEQRAFDHFDRGHVPEVFFAGMMEYDGDQKIPQNFLVPPPQISDTLGHFLSDAHLRQFACSETQKFGHVTYFWNGNRSGYIDPSTEEYLEIASFPQPFDHRPWMRADAITTETEKRLMVGGFDFGRINFPNGDMVGHTGDLDASITAVSVIDLMIGRLVDACKKSATILVVTADHGNCDEMFLGRESDHPDWQTADKKNRPQPRTAHSLAEVPFLIYDPLGAAYKKTIWLPGLGRLSNFANTALELMGLPQAPDFDPSLLRPKP